MADNAELLTEADKAFVAAMQAIDAESDASAKEFIESAGELRKAFVTEAEERIKHPLNANGGPDPANPGASPATA